MADAGPAASCAQGARRREVGTCAVAAEREALGIEVKVSRMAPKPPQHRRAIVEGAGKPRLRSASIVDGNDRAPAAVRQPMADRVVRVEIAEHEAATVTEDDGRQSCHARGPVDTHVQRTRRARD